MFCNSYQTEFEKLLLHVLYVRQQIGLSARMQVTRNLLHVAVVAIYAWQHAPQQKLSSLLTCNHRQAGF